MLKIVRGLGPAYNPTYEMGEPVKINNIVRIPSDSDDEEQEQEEVVSAEELRRIEEEEKAEQERRFNEAVNAEVTRIISARADSIDAERAKIIEKAQKLAADMAADAKATTLSIMEKAEKECVLLKEQAKKEGFDEGFGQGREESLEKYKKYIDAAGKLLAEINSRKDAYYISNEEELRKTAFEVIQKVVFAEIENDPTLIDNIIAEAAKNFRNADYIKITLAEDEITERFRTDEKLIKEIIPFIPEIEIEFDSEAEEGTVILDDGSESVDAGVPTQLEFLQEIMKNTRGEE